MHHWNFTYNLGPMWRSALEDTPWRETNWRMAQVDDMTGAESTGLLAFAAHVLRMQPGKHKALSPDNGWGSYEGLLEGVESMLAAARLHPDWVWRACR